MVNHIEDIHYCMRMLERTAMACNQVASELFNLSGHVRVGAR